LRETRGRKEAGWKRGEGTEVKIIEEVSMRYPSFYNSEKGDRLRDERILTIEEETASIQEDLDSGLLDHVVAQFKAKSEARPEVPGDAINWGDDDLRSPTSPANEE
jgi:hypothetical protein